MKIDSKYQTRFSKKRGYTLVEVVVAMGITAITLAATITGYLATAARAEWSAYSLAANEMALLRLEQARATKWDLQIYPNVDELVQNNFPAQVHKLDVPIGGIGSVSYATNVTTIRQISANPPLKYIQVDCIWQYRPGEVFTNTVSTYRAPDA